MENSTVDTAIIAACVTGSLALISGALAAFLTYRSSKLSRENEHKLSILKVLLDAAYKEYEFRAKLDLESALKYHQEPKIKSFIEYIIFYKEFSDVFIKENITENDILITLQKNKILIDKYYSSKNDYKPEYHK